MDPWVLVIPAGQTQVQIPPLCVSWANDVTFLSLIFLTCQMGVSGLETETMSAPC